MHHPVSAGRTHRLSHFGLWVLAAVYGISWAHAEGVSEASLPDVTVSGRTFKATTEGTGSYTTGQASTATPLGLSLRDTPQSVSVVTRQRIEDQGSQTLLDVVDNAVGMSVHRFETNRVNFISRGFKVTNLMVDGVPTPWDSTWTAGEVFSSLALYDRVEIVRGATGLTSGTGDPSAAVNLMRKRAASKTLTGTAELGLGSWNERRGLADVSTPLNRSGSVRARVAAEYRQKDSWVDLKQDEAKTFYATLSADLAPKTQLSVGFARQDDETDSPMWGGLPYWYADGTAADWPRSKTTAARWARWDSQYENAFADLEHRFDNGWKARVSVSHGDRRGDTPLLYVMGSPDRATGQGLLPWPGWYRNRTEQDSLGLSASGSWRLGGRTHEAGFGYARYRTWFSADSRKIQPGSIAPIGDFNAWDGSYPEPVWTSWDFYQKDRTEQQAVYGVARLNVADPLRVILGMRLTDYEKTGFSASGAVASRMKFAREVTPYVGAIYDLNDTYSAYVSYTDIFQPQQVRDVAGRTLDPILGKSAEAGVKAEFLEGRLNGSMALFRIEQDGLGRQTSEKVAGNNQEDAYAPSQGATSKGFELELSGEVRPGWAVNAGYTWFRLRDATGTEVNTIYPRRLLRLFTAYRLPGAWNALTLGGGVNWQSRTWTDATNPLGARTRIEQKGYTLVNLMTRYAISKRWSAQLNVDNLFDQKYYGLFDAYDQITYGEPRSVSAAVRYTF